MKHLLKSEVDRDNADLDENEEDEDEDDNLDEVEQAKKRRNSQHIDNQENSKYINLDFILGSVAEVERLWSMALYVLVKNRQKMTPIVFEAICFLKINKDVWDECDIVEAMARQKSIRVQQQIEEDEDQLDN